MSQGLDAGSAGGEKIERELLDVAITAAEIAIVGDYLSKNRGTLPEGLADAKPLPPGIAKNLARGKPMPPGIAKTRLPGGLTDQLPLYVGYEWAAAGTDLLLINAVSGLIADVARDIF